MTHVLLFDVDGVIMKTFNEAGGFLWTKDIEADLNLKPEHMQILFSGQWADVITGKIDTRDYFAERLKAVQSDVPVDAFIAYWLEKDSCINQNVLNLIKSLQNVKSLQNAKICLATNQEELRTNHIAKIIDHSFDSIFSSHKIGFAKPKMEFFAAIEAELNVPAQRITLIDDSSQNIDAARKRGWTIHHYKTYDELSIFLNSYI